MPKSPYLILILDANGQVVGNILCDEVKWSRAVTGPIWANWRDVLDNPLGTMMQSSYVTIYGKVMPRKEPEE
jgi:hypothetical protein